MSSNDQIEKLKYALIEVLKFKPKTQVENIMVEIQARINRKLTESDENIILELIHEFSTSNILMPAMSRHSSGWPWFSVTKHGEKILNESGPPVYDYDEYIRHIKKRVTDIDQIILMYLSESLRAFQFNLYYSSMVMLACSSERAILMLIEKYIESIDKVDNKNKLKSRISKRDISVKYAEFKKSFDSTKNQITGKSISNDFDIHVDSIFNFIRLLRNSIVHPDSIPQITSSIAYSNLQQFSYYIETIYKLLDFYSNNKTIV